MEHTKNNSRTDVANSYPTNLHLKITMTVGYQSAVFSTLQRSTIQRRPRQRTRTASDRLVSLDNKPDLLATNPYFINDGIIPTANTGVNNPFLSAQSDTLDTNAQTQNWLTTPFGDLMNLLSVGKKARRSPRGFR